MTDHSKEDGREYFSRRQDIGRRALALADDNDDQTNAADVISDILTAVYGDPRNPTTLADANALLARAINSYQGDAEDYDWPIDSP